MGWDGMDWDGLGWDGMRWGGMEWGDLIFNYLCRVVHSVMVKRTDLQCGLSKILANLLKNNTVQYKDKRKINIQCSN